MEGVVDEDEQDIGVVASFNNHYKIGELTSRIKMPETEKWCYLLITNSFPDWKLIIL